MTRSGIAVDLGTTTVSVARVSLSDGLVLATAEARNAQAQDYGRDILSRLSAAMAGERDRLRDLAQSQVIELMGQEPAERIVAAGNSVMAALFVGADVSGLATAPFAPVRDLPEVMQDPVLHERGTLFEVDHPAYGRLTLNGSALRFFDTETQPYSCSPDYGHDNAEIYGALGVDAAAMARLRDEGTI